MIYHSWDKDSRKLEWPVVLGCSLLVSTPFYGHISNYCLSFHGFVLNVNLLFVMLQLMSQFTPHFLSQPRCRPRGPFSWKLYPPLAQRRPAPCVQPNPTPTSSQVRPHNLITKTTPSVDGGNNSIWMHELVLLISGFIDIGWLCKVGTPLDSR